MGRKAKRMSPASLTQSVLQLLVDARNQGWPFIPLEEVSPKLIRDLVRRQWIFLSPGGQLDADRFKILPAGEMALQEMLAPRKRRKTGIRKPICPICGIRPKRFRPSGKLAPYCNQCENERSREKWHRNAPRFKSNICTRCKKNQRYVYPSGRMVAYCKRCLRIVKNENKQKNKQRKLEAARRGELMCIRCKMNPRHFTEHSVYDYCRDCLRTYMNEYNDRRRPDSGPAKLRKGQS